MAVIAVEIVPVGVPASTSYAVQPTLALSNINIASITTTDWALSTQASLPLFSNLNVNSYVVSYTTMTDANAGPVAFGFLNPIADRISFINRPILTDYTLGAQILNPSFSNMSSNASVVYTTMTNSIAGGVDVNVVKPFGDTPQREYWL